METATLVAAGWTSGINAYLTVLVLGLAGRFGWADTPASLQRPWVLAVCGALFLVEFVVDKIPLLDSAWDSVHTFIRPAVAAMVGAAATQTALHQPAASLVAAGLALTAHASKASTRLAINVSPEPFTNIVASFTEDGVVLGVVALALARPRLAAVVALLAMVLFLAVALALLSLARKGVRALRRRLSGRGGYPPPSGTGRSSPSPLR